MGNQRTPARILVLLFVLTVTLPAADRDTATAAVSVSTAQPPARVRLALSQVLEGAAAKARTDQARLELARRNAEYLETQNRIRVDLRPSLGLLAFSNPLLLAGNLVSGLTIGKRGAPSGVSLQAAWFDVVTAEVNAERAKVRAQTEAARAFYTLLEKQQLSAQAARRAAHARDDLADVATLVQAARLTALDKLGADERQLAAELEAVETESSRRAAAMDLAMAIGRPEIAELVEVLDPPSTEDSLKLPILSDETVFERAFQYRADARLLRDRIGALRGRARQPGAGSAHPQSISVGYGYVAGVPGGVSRSAENFLLGGNTGRVDLNFALSLRDTGEKAAQAALAEARAALLEAELQSLESDIRREAFALNNAMRASQQRLGIARQRLLLAQNGAAMTAARVEGGLADPQARIQTRQSLEQAQAELVRAECLRKANQLALQVLCGLDESAAAAGRLQALR